MIESVKWFSIRSLSNEDHSGWYYLYNEYWYGPHSHKSEAEIGLEIAEGLI